MKLVTLAALLGVACAQDNEAAKTYVRDYWRDSFVAGDKALFATRGVGEDMGNDKIKAMCFAKGGTNTVLEPLMLADIHSSLIRIQSRAACTVAGSDNILGVAQSSRRRLADAGSGERDTDACGLPPLTCCPTRDGGEGPARADGIPICPPAPPLARTDSWFGEYHADVYGSFTFKVSMVNGQELSEGLTDARTWSIEELKGVGASIIAPDGYDSGDAANPKGVRYDAVHYGEGHRPWAMYDGGMVVTAKVGDWFTYRMFMFKNEETLEAARAVPENLGLQYATTFPGENGCNAEVVLELSPKSDGGLEAHASIEQLFTNVIRTVTWYATEAEVVVLASKAQITAASRVDFTPADGCDDGEKELVRFSRKFICKATGESVTASISGPEGAGLGTFRTAAASRRRDPRT